MNKEIAVGIIWDYMHMGHTLQPADIIFILGSHDLRVASHAATLYHQGFAPIIAISGDGTQHVNSLLRDTHQGHTEAAALKEICLAAGVPETNIILEDKANNTGENFAFMKPVLDAKQITIRSAIMVQKPYMERRAYATGKIWWPDVDLILSSQPGTFSEYCGNVFDPDTIINIMLGDLERIKEYPARGFQIHQDIPLPVWQAFEYLVSLGYSKNLLRS